MRRVAKMTLFHEMVHIKLRFSINHGPEFQREMLRLVKAGAFRDLW